MSTLITEKFLLENETARELYFSYAAPQPIYDYHCHLSPSLLASNYRFRNLTEIWLGGDHYKWRAMRVNGVEEKYCTGQADDYEKFLAFVRTIPYALRNPLYHWSHLELLRYFDIDLTINEANAREIWNRANERLADPQFGTQSLVDKNRVALICTTDDPVDSLEFHEQLRQQDLRTRIYPTFRPDLALKVDSPVLFNTWCHRLSEASGLNLTGFGDFLAAIRQRHDFFHSKGCRLSDHGLEFCLANECNESQATMIFNQVRRGQPATPTQLRQFGTFMMLYFGRLDAARNWTKQLHLGALRNNNQRLSSLVGADAGADSIGDFSQAVGLSYYLNTLDATGELPKTILYNLNPADNYVLATMAGNFSAENQPGKIQFGSGWWFLDQIEGMTWQLNALSNLGLLRRFVGMTTDSRSFLSYPRHEYFRRLLCNIIGQDVERGLLPRDLDLLGSMVREISFGNARNYFGLELAAEYSGSAHG